MSEVAVHLRRSPGEEVRSIGGYYRVIEESTIPVDDREVVYTLTGCELDTSCCGPGGSAEIIVSGYIVPDPEGGGEGSRNRIMVERVGSGSEKERVISSLREKYPSFIRIEFE